MKGVGECGPGGWRLAEARTQALRHQLGQAREGRGRGQGSGEGRRGLWPFSMGHQAMSGDICGQHDGRGRSPWHGTTKPLAGPRTPHPRDPGPMSSVPGTGPGGVAVSASCQERGRACSSGQGSCSLPACVHVVKPVFLGLWRKSRRASHAAGRASPGPPTLASSEP